ncbi:hypothetical protein [Mycobacteroides abscessus]|uniref:hypothetical protein n=1 Tax=Mycobacteroides abscessus TaxID=36809 RepID=UPI0009410AAA|nr:hypothetical protein [Mycobacteroides abscessus]
MTATGDAAASADGRNSGSGTKPVTKTRALTDPKPSTSGVLGASVAADKPVASTVAGVAEAAGAKAKEQLSGGKAVSETSAGAGAVQSEHNTASVAAGGAKADPTQLSDLKPLQPNVTHDIASPSSVPSVLTDDTGQAKPADAQTPARESNRSASHAGTDAGAKATDTSGSLRTSTVTDTVGGAVTSTVRIGQSSPATSAITDVKAPEHLTTVQIPTRQSSTATTQTSAASKTVAVAAVTAPAAPAPAPVAPVAPLPVPVVPANAPTAPGGATASITSALADVRKRGEGSGDTVTQEPANTGQVLHIQNVSAAAVTEGSGEAVDTALRQAVKEQVADVTGAFETAATQEAEDAPRIRVRRDIGSANNAGDGAVPPGGGSEGVPELPDVPPLPDPISDPFNFVKANHQFQADVKKATDDLAAWRQRQQVLEADKEQFRTSVEQYNKAATALNSEDASIQQENATLTADILKHNATSPLFKIWPLNGAYNAEGAALAARQAAFNARVIAHNNQKIVLDRAAELIRSQEENINARAGLQQAEVERLAANAQQLMARERDLNTALAHPDGAPPTSITGYSRHAEEQIAGRDGGIGVNRAALEDAFNNPQAVTRRVDSEGRISYRYKGKDAVVNVNPQGVVTTGWGRGSGGTGTGV